MKKDFKKIIALMLVFSMLFSNLAFAEESFENGVDNMSAAMINYLSMKTYEAIECDYNIYYLQNILDELRGKIKRDAVKNDKETENYVFQTLLKKLTDLKLASNAYNRIKEVLANAKSKALREAAIEAAKGAQGISGEDGAVGWISKGLGTAALSALTYQEVMSEAKEGFDENEFNLNQESIKTVDGLKNDLLHYNFDLGDGKNIDDRLLLREDDIIKYLEIKKYSTVDLRIADFEKNQERFSKYPNYWLDLCTDYYLRGEETNNKDDYKKCIEALKKYEEYGGTIFREGKDIDFHEKIPFAISSAKNIYNKNEYIKFAEEYLNKMDGDLSWELAYYKAEVYKDLYKLTSNKEYIKKGYEVINNNVTSLVNDQCKKNEVFDKKVSDAIKKSGADGTVYLDEYYPVSDALVFYLDDLFEFANILNISESEKKAIDRRLHRNNERLFNVWPVDNKYWFYMPENINEDNELLNKMLWIDYSTDDNKQGMFSNALGYLVCEDSNIEVIDENNNKKISQKNIVNSYKDLQDYVVGYHTAIYGPVNDSMVGNIYEIQVTPKVGCDYDTYTAKYRLCKSDKKDKIDLDTVKSVGIGSLLGPIGIAIGIATDQNKKNSNNYYFELVEEE